MLNLDLYKHDVFDDFRIPRNLSLRFLQSSSMIFGAHTKRHQLAEGDKVLALNDTGWYKYQHFCGDISGFFQYI